MDVRPDQEEMEQAINKFLQRLEKQEKRGFKDLATLLSQLPKLAQGSARSMSVAEAMEAGFLPALDKDQAYMFTQSELCLYLHAKDHRLLSLDILGYPSLFGNILGLSTGQFLSCRCSRIAPCNSMNVTFLVYADNAVYQICTYAVKSQDPDKGTISVAAVSG